MLTGPVRLVARLARALGVAALVLALPAAGAPPAGTVISNQATAMGTIGAATQSVGSNVVQLTTSAPLTGMTLVASATLPLGRGEEIFFPHTLTNTGSVTDTYQLAVVDQPGNFDLLGLEIFPDANGDGRPDTWTPVTLPVVLAPGQAYRFLVRAIAPVNAPSNGIDRFEVRASSLTPGGPAPVSNLDTATVFVTPVNPPLPDGLWVEKFFSLTEGPSPSEEFDVLIRYSNSTLDSAAKREVTITDRLPEGLAYVPGSARWSWAGTAPLTDAAGGDPQGIAYDFGATAAGTATAVIADMRPGVKGELRFRVRVEAGRDPGEMILNVARFRYIDSKGAQTAFVETRPANYLVLGSIDLTLTGDRIALAKPGTTVSFNNVLTNRGTVAETFNILLGTSTFPAGTRIRLYGPDGVTPLADSNGDGLPDVGVVAPGQSVRIVVKVDLPSTLVPGEYSVQKTAQSARAPSRRATASDVVAAVEKACRVDLTPDNQAQSAYGRHVTYTHYLENRGNCEESVRVVVGFIGDSLPGWVSAAYIDNPKAGGASIPGVLDRTDTPVVQGWTALLAPGQALRVLVDVLAPPDPGAAKQGAKALAETNITTLTIDSATSGALKVIDKTTLDDEDATIRPQDVLRNFTDPSYLVPTAWAVLGGTAWLRADAASCNADPGVAESRTVVVTGPNGEREEVLATETGANTGVFIVPAMPVRGPPVVAGDRILQGRPLDVFEAEILGCGRRIATAITLTEPAGVVFDSTTNEPVAGAVATLVAASGGRCSATPVSTGGNPATTGADGRYAFPVAIAGDYCVAVAPPNGYAAPSKVPYGQLVPGRNLVVTGPTSGGSYGQPFHAGGNGIVVDVPVDPAALSGLFVQKAASRLVVELGSFVDYALRVRNGTGNTLDRASVQLVDDLPAGFAYVSGSVRSEGRTLAEPVNGGARLVFALGSMARGQEIVVSYRVRVGPGALQGDGTNRVQATYTANGATTASNVATAKVQVLGGVFSDRGFIVGKVFLDCNANGEQDAGEAGVPGVRLFIEDGTYVVTDGQGRYSFYGLVNRTHSLKVDVTTLPAGAKLVPLGTRNLGDGASRIVDLKAGEMHRGDFAIAGCEGPVADELRARARMMEGGVDPLAALAGTQLSTDARSVPDVKALPASGIVGAPGQPGGAPALDAPAGSSRVTPYASVLEVPAATRPTPSPRLALAAAGQPAEPLEQLVPSLDKELGFIGLKEGDTLPYAQATVRVKGMAGATLKLSVNGIEIPETRIGKRSTLAETQVQALEYIGVELKAGPNELSLAQLDPFGNARGTATIRVNAPGKAGKLVIELPRGGAVADGKTYARVAVKLLDEKGAPVTSRTPVTLASSVGLWKVDDAEPAEPGVQTFIEGGQAEFPLAPPLEPGSTQIVVTSGKLRAEARLDFLPELRSLVATGVIEGVVNMRNINSRALVPTRATDDFEQELRQFSRDWNDGKSSAGARAAFFLKGKIQGDYLLTAAYDSDKDTRERLFRDIQPDEFYPVYGDSAVRGYDAQSTSKLYVRVDKNRSYLLWGDFTTQVLGDMRRLSNYGRSLTGMKAHYENERVSANAFATRDTTRQVIEELRANGTSGPYQLSTMGALVNSEKVEIITRDRNQSSIVLASLPQARFVDYEIETLTGRILFRSPVASIDRDLNPVFVRVIYEVDQGGQEFWVAGVDAQVKLTERFEVGGTYVKDQNPLLPFTLAGANAVVKLGESTYVIGEVARTENGTQGVKGDAARLEIKHDAKDFKAQAFVARSDPEFSNPGAWLSNGRAEAGGRAEYKVREGTLIRAEALRTEDVATGSLRDGALVAVTQDVAKNLTLELGMRYAAEKGTTSPIPPIQGTPPPEPLPDEVTTVRARLTGQVPYVSGASVYGEAEVDVKDTDRRILAVGGEYALPNRGRLYGRHEFISSITGPYGLNATERQNTTAVGVDFDYMQDGRMFSEYRIRDAMSGGDAEAAIGLKNLWTLAPGLRLGTSIERVHALSGTGQNENTAGAIALEYTANPFWKGTTRLELRDASTTESLLFTVGLAAKLNRDWTALARNAYSLQRAKDGGNERVVERMQAGLAWRDTETNQWNALGRIEHRLDQDDTQVGIQLKSTTTIVSLHADWQPRRPFLVSGRYAAKWTTDKSNGLASKYRAQVIGGRATWEFAPKWDIGFVTSLLVGESFDSRQYGVGLELGYLVTTNLWVSAGYNLFGYRDADLSGADYTTKGPYVRLRYKFDEGVFGEGHSGAPKAVAAPAKPAQAGTTATQSTDAPVPATGGSFVPLAPSSSVPGAAGAGVPL